MGSQEEHFQHLNILCLPKLHSFSVGKFIHSYHNKLLPNHFDEYFISLSSILTQNGELKETILIQNGKLDKLTKIIQNLENKLNGIQKKDGSI